MIIQTPSLCQQLANNLFTDKTLLFLWKGPGLLTLALIAGVFLLWFLAG